MVEIMEVSADDECLLHFLDTNESQKKADRLLGRILEDDDDDCDDEDCCDDISRHKSLDPFDRLHLTAIIEEFDSPFSDSPIINCDASVGMTNPMINEQTTQLLNNPQQQQNLNNITTTTTTNNQHHHQTIDPQQQQIIEQSYRENPDSTSTDNCCEIIQSPKQESLKEESDQRRKNKETVVGKYDAANKARTSNSRSKQQPTLSKYRRKTANARERIRMREINTAFEKLKTLIPCRMAQLCISNGEESDQSGSLVSKSSSSLSCSSANDSQANFKLTKINTLRLAVSYIAKLSDILNKNSGDEDESDIEIISQLTRDSSCLITITKDEINTVTANEEKPQIKSNNQAQRGQKSASKCRRNNSTKLEKGKKRFKLDSNNDVHNTGSENLIVTNKTDKNLNNDSISETNIIHHPIRSNNHVAQQSITAQLSYNQQNSKFINSENSACIHDSNFNCNPTLLHQQPIHLPASQFQIQYGTDVLNNDRTFVAPVAVAILGCNQPIRLLGTIQQPAPSPQPTLNSNFVYLTQNNLPPVATNQAHCAQQLSKPCNFKIALAPQEELKFISRHQSGLVYVQPQQQHPQQYTQHSFGDLNIGKLVANITTSIQPQNNKGIPIQLTYLDPSMNSNYLDKNVDINKQQQQKQQLKRTYRFHNYYGNTISNHVYTNHSEGNDNRQLNNNDSNNSLQNVVKTKNQSKTVNIISAVTDESTNTTAPSPTNVANQRSRQNSLSSTCSTASSASSSSQ